MGEVSIMSVDLAKNVFQVHGVAADGSVQFLKKAVASSVRMGHDGAGAVPGGDGGKCQRTKH